MSLAPDLSAEDMWDKSEEGLKSSKALKVRKDNWMKIDEGASVARRLKVAIKGSRRTPLVPMSNEPTPIEIGNVESRKGREKKKFTDEENA